MKETVYVLVVFLVLVAGALVRPVSVLAEGDATISATFIGDGTFITVKESVAGDVLSLYRIKGDRIILLDSVVNTSSRSDRDVKLSERFLHRLDVENK